jgi:hypothetical protein
MKGQDADIPSDLVFTWRSAAHQEGDTTFFRSKISRRGRPFWLEGLKRSGEARGRQEA